MHGMKVNGEKKKKNKNIQLKRNNYKVLILEQLTSCIKDVRYSVSLKHTFLNECNKFIVYK